MKPPLFDYASPETIADAVSALSSNPGAMVLAGGQSLVPAMNFRLASPSVLVDLQRIPGLDTISIDDGVIRVGAMVRHRDLELNDAVNAVHPLIREVMAHVAHVPIRNRGTVVGSLCHADAAAEMPLLLVLTDGAVKAVGPKGERIIAARDLFQFHMTTTREADEIVTEAHFPVPAKGAGLAFDEFARRHGDYAIAAIGALVEKNADGTVSRAALAACGIGDRPTRLAASEAALTGTRLADADLEAAVTAARDEITAPDDMHATNAYRKHLTGALIKRVVAAAAARAK